MSNHQGLNQMVDQTLDPDGSSGLTTASLPDGLISATGLPVQVLAGQTTRHPLLASPRSQMPYDGFNLALHVGDVPVQVQQQRMALLQALEPQGAHRLVWLEQTHSTRVQVVDEQIVNKQTGFLALDADALITRQVGVACLIMTADCLPIVLSNAAGTEVACIHAGWKGLLNGVIENTLAAMQSPATHAWFGTAIGSCHFEVGQDVYQAFTQQDPASASAFVAQANAPHQWHNNQSGSKQSDNKYLADLYQLASLRLSTLQISHPLAAQACSYHKVDQFYSYRRAAQTGRMATFVMIRP